MKHGAALAVVAMLAAACGQTHDTPSHQSRKVFLIVMENHSYTQAIRGEYTASLATRYRVATNYHAITHPSVPNYLALTSGKTWGVVDDSYHQLPREDLGTQLTSKGLSWRAYMEGMTRGCLDSPVPYDPGHNPFAYYGGGCPPNVVPLTSLSADLGAKTPLFTWITPDMCHDTHNCSVSVGDDWLRAQVGEILASGAWKDNGLLIITWDEDDQSENNRVLTLFIAPGKSHVSSNKPYNHYSLLATIEDVLRVGRLGEAAKATPMTDLID